MKPLIAFGALVPAFIFLLAGCAGSSGVEYSSPSNSSPCQGSQPVEELEPLVVTVSQGVTELPYVQWGIDSGCFQSHGLDVVIQTSSSSAVEKVAAIVGGSSDVGADGVVEVVRGIAGEGFGGEFQLVANGYGYSESELALARAGGVKDGQLAISTALVGRAGQGFEDLEDLRGRKVGLSTSGSTALGLRLALEGAGIPLSDVDFIDLASSERVVALERGDIDFAVLSGTVATTQVAAGATVVGYPGAFLYQGGSVIFFYSLAERIAEKEAEMVAFQRAMTEINAWLADPANLDEFRTYLSDDFGLDPEEAQRFVMPNFSLGMPPVETFETYRRILAEPGDSLENSSIPTSLVWVEPK